MSLFLIYLHSYLLTNTEIIKPFYNILAEYIFYSTYIF